MGILQHFLFGAQLPLDKLPTASFGLCEELGLGGLP